MSLIGRSLCGLLGDEVKEHGSRVWRDANISESRYAAPGRESLFLEDEVGGYSAGCDFDPMGYAGGDVDDVSCVEDYLFSAVDAGGEGFAGAAGAAVGMLSLHGAAGDKGDCAFFDYDLVGEELMALGFAGAGADYQEGVVVAVVFEPSDREAGGACLCGFG
jgi:hypothetical protein